MTTKAASRPNTSIAGLRRQTDDLHTRRTDEAVARKCAYRGMLAETLRRTFGAGLAGEGLLDEIEKVDLEMGGRIAQIPASDAVSKFAAHEDLVDAIQCSIGRCCAVAGHAAPTRRVVMDFLLDLRFANRVLATVFGDTPAWLIGVAFDPERADILDLYAQAAA